MSYTDEAAPNNTVWNKECGGGQTEEVFALQNPDFAFNVFVTGPLVRSYPILTSSPSAFNIASLTGFLASGTVTVSVEIDGVPVPGLTGVVLTTTEQTFNASGTSDYVAVGARVTLNITSITTPVDLELTVHCTR
ncbi:MAG: hypothetical protein ACR2PS_06000 [Pseudomonadales bacterium]